MLSRAASSLYWLGRYIERAEFTSRLVEATLRLDAVSAPEVGAKAWEDALEVLGQREAFMATGAPLGQSAVTRFLTVEPSNSGSVLCCLDAARDNAKAVRIALSRDAWSAINRAWLLFRAAHNVGNNAAALELVERAEIETRAFEGAIGRMLKNPSSIFVRLGAVIERADGIARLIDAKAESLPEDPFAVADVTVRDQWQMVLQAVSAVNAYRWVYREGLKPAAVIDLLALRRELPRSLLACAEEAVTYLNMLGKFTGLQGEADRWARQRAIALKEAKLSHLMGGNLVAFLHDFMASNLALDRAITRQFRFH